MNALKGVDSALAKNTIVAAIRKSMQGQQIQNLTRMGAMTNNLGTIIESIRQVMNISFTIMKDLKARLVAMPKYCVHADYA